MEGDQPRGTVGDLAGNADAVLNDDLAQRGNGGLELGDECGDLPVAASPVRRSPRRTFAPTTWASLAAASAMVASS
ncbi:MAG: hypothetical protein ACRDYE_05145, partial [Acidimicrobiales bacterium]